MERNLTKPASRLLTAAPRTTGPSLAEIAKSMACFNCLFPAASASSNSASLWTPSSVRVWIVILRFPGMFQFVDIEGGLAMVYIFAQFPDGGQHENLPCNTKQLSNPIQRFGSN